MIQYVILGWLIYEILRLAQQSDASAVKFTPPPPTSESSGRSTGTAVPLTPPPSTTAAPPEAPKSEVATAKSG